MAKEITTYDYLIDFIDQLKQNVIDAIKEDKHITIDCYTPTELVPGSGFSPCHQHTGEITWIVNIKPKIK